jgi:hypothetical protein
MAAVMIDCMIIGQKVVWWLVVSLAFQAPPDASMFVIFSR